MAKLNAFAAAIALAGIVNRAVAPETMEKLISASQATQKLSPDALSEEQREKLANSKGSLLTVARQATYELVQAVGEDGKRLAATPEAVDVLIGLAVQNGASANTLGMYSSTLRRYAAAVGREENPADPEALVSDSVNYAELRKLIATPEEANRADLKERYRVAWQDMTDAQRAEFVRQVEAATAEAKAARIAKADAKKAGRVGATSAASTGPTSHVDPLEPTTGEGDEAAADSDEGVAEAARIAAGRNVERPARQAGGRH